MKKALVLLVPLAITFFLYLPPAAWGQELQPLDIPGSGRAPALTRDLPVSPEIRTALQKALDAHDFVGAETILVKEIDRNPKSAPLLTFVASLFFLDGEYLNTAIALKKAEALAPLDDRSRFTLAMAYIAVRQAKWATPELKKLARSDAKNPLYPYWLGRIEYDTRQYAAAVIHFQKALELDPDFMKAYDNLGLSYEGLGEYNLAVQSYKQAIVLNQRKLPPSPWPPLNLATLLIRLGRLDEGRSYIQESLRYDPRFAKAHYQMGLLLEKEKKDEEAVQELQQATVLDAALAAPYYRLAEIYRRRGDREKAKAAWAAFQRLKEANGRVRPAITNERN